jgi:MFS transporter, NNP family, nitrate/nitrite transporter
VLATCMLLMHLAIKQERYEQRLREAVANNFLNQD